MRVLHIRDHTVPYFSGYSFHTKYILGTQKNLGMQPVALTLPKHEKMDALREDIDGIAHYRTRMDNGFLPQPIQATPFIKENLSGGK